MTRTTVVVADGMTMLRSAVKATLTRHGGFAVVEAGDLTELLELVRTREPEIALVDLDLPPRGGIEAAARLSELGETRCVLWTLRPDSIDVLEAVRAGAIGFLNKDIAPEGLLRALQATANGEHVLSRAAASKMISALRALEDRERARARTAALSEREREVLALIAHGYRNREIAQRLVISELTVKRHVQNILRKVGRSSRRDAAQLYRAAGETVRAVA